MDNSNIGSNLSAQQNWQKYAQLYSEGNQQVVNQVETYKKSNLDKKEFDTVELSKSSAQTDEEIQTQEQSKWEGVLSWFKDSLGIEIDVLSIANSKDTAQAEAQAQVQEAQTQEGQKDIKEALENSTRDISDIFDMYNDSDTKLNDTTKKAVIASLAKTLEKGVIKDIKGFVEKLDIELTDEEKGLIESILGNIAKSYGDETLSSSDFASYALASALLSSSETKSRDDVAQVSKNLSDTVIGGKKQTLASLSKEILGNSQILASWSEQSVEQILQDISKLDEAGSDNTIAKRDMWRLGINALNLSSQSADLEKDEEGNPVDFNALRNSEEAAKIEKEYIDAITNRQIKIQLISSDNDNPEITTTNLTYANLISGTVNYASKVGGLNSSKAAGTDDLTYASSTAYRLTDTQGNIVVSDISEIPQSISTTTIPFRSETEDGSQTALAKLIQNKNNTYEIDTNNNLIKANGSIYSINTGELYDADSLPHAPRWTAAEEVNFEAKGNKTTGNKISTSTLYTLKDLGSGVYGLTDEEGEIYNNQKYTIDNSLKGGEEGPNYLQDAIRNGKFLVEQGKVNNESGKLDWSTKNVSEMTNVMDILYTDDDAAAYQKYVSDMANLTSSDIKLPEGADPQWPSSKLFLEHNKSIGNLTGVPAYEIVDSNTLTYTTLTADMEKFYITIDDEGNIISTETQAQYQARITHNGARVEINENPYGFGYDTVEYDDNNRIIKSSGYDSSGHQFLSEYSYYDNGSMQTQTTRNADGSLYLTVEYTSDASDGDYSHVSTYYTDDNKVNIVQHWDTSGRLSDAIYYDSEGKAVSESKYDHNGKIESEKYFSYDSQGDVSKIELYTADGAIISSEEYKYTTTKDAKYVSNKILRNSDGNTTADIHYYSDGRIYYQNEYEYDEDGNKSSHTRTVVNGGGTANYTEYFDENGRTYHTDFFSIKTGEALYSENYGYDEEGKKQYTEHLNTNNELQYVRLQKDGNYTPPQTSTPNSKITVRDFDNSTLVEFNYDAQGNLTTRSSAVKDIREIQNAFAYDGANTLSQSRSLQYGYVIDKPIFYTFDIPKNSYPESSSTGSGSYGTGRVDNYVATYDELGRISTVECTNKQYGRSTYSYEYYSNGEFKEKQTDSSTGVIIETIYNKDGSIKQHKEFWNQQNYDKDITVITRNYSYSTDANGNPVQTMSNSAGITVIETYDLKTGKYVEVSGKTSDIFKKSATVNYDEDGVLSSVALPAALLSDTNTALNSIPTEIETATGKSYYSAALTNESGTTIGSVFYSREGKLQLVTFNSVEYEYSEGKFSELPAVELF